MASTTTLIRKTRLRAIDSVHDGGVQSLSGRLGSLQPPTTARTVIGPLLGFYNDSQQGSTPSAQLESIDEAGASLFGALIDYWHYTGDD
ncbi:MAG: hypothetical protein Q9182_006993 [Xanthomendoza sp. 2 TL-2023]